MPDVRLLNRLVHYLATSSKALELKSEQHLKKAAAKVRFRFGFCGVCTVGEGTAWCGVVWYGVISYAFCWIVRLRHARVSTELSTRPRLKKCKVVGEI